MTQSMPTLQMIPGSLTMMPRRQASAPPSTTTHHTSPQTLPATTDSALANIMAVSIQQGYATNLSAILAWQCNAGSKVAKQKVFHQEVIQQMELVVFGFMRGHSLYIHLLHSASTSAALESEADYKGKDIRFLGNKTANQSPLSVLLPSDIWTWIVKPASLDMLAPEHYYSIF